MDDSTKDGLDVADGVCDVLGIEAEEVIVLAGLAEELCGTLLVDILETAARVTEVWAIELTLWTEMVLGSCTLICKRCHETGQWRHRRGTYLCCHPLYITSNGHRYEGVGSIVRILRQPACFDYGEGRHVCPCTMRGNDFTSRAYQNSVDSRKVTACARAMIPSRSRVDRPRRHGERQQEDSRGGEQGYQRAGRKE